MPQVFDSGELNENSHNAFIHVAFPIVQQGRHSQAVISEFYTAPMHTPTNPGIAGPCHHWSSTHSSGSRHGGNRYSLLRRGLDFAISKLKSHLLPHAGFNRRFLDAP